GNPIATNLVKGRVAGTTEAGKVLANDRHFSLYPNPTGDLVQVAQNEITGETFELRVISMQGKEIYSSAFNNSHTISLRGYNPGIYYVVLQSSNSKFTYKLVKL